MSRLVKLLMYGYVKLKTGQYGLVSIRSLLGRNNLLFWAIMGTSVMLCC